MTATVSRPLFGILPWLLASLAAHAAMLWGAQPWKGLDDTVAGANSTAALRVQLVHGRQDRAADTARPEPAAARATETVTVPDERPGAAAEVKRPSHRVRSAASTAPAPVPAATAVADAEERLPVRPHTLPLAAPAASAATGDANATDSAELMSLLHAAIDRQKRYPQSALSMGREGSTRVAFRLRPDGHIDDLNIGASSGVRALDAAAYRAVEAIAPLAGADRYLQRTQRFEVDVVFRLN